MKLLLKLFIAIGVLVVAGIALLLILVDPNDYKAEIEAQVKQSLNRDLHIKGELDWALYPQLGFSSGEIELDNLESFNKPHLIKINQAALGINILPLLQGEISLAKLTIEDLELNIIINEDGVSNIDNMAADTPASSNSTTKAAENSESTDSFFDISKTQLAGIDINNAVIELQDLQAGSNQKIIINEIKLGQFELGKATPFSISTAISSDDIVAQIALSTQLLISKDLESFQLNQLSLTTQLSSDALPNGELQSTLKSNINYAASSKIITLDDVDIRTNISGDNLPNNKVTTQFNAQTITLQGAQAAINKLTLLVDDKLQLDGAISLETTAITKVRYNLVANQWDLSPYLSESETTDDSASTDPVEQKGEEVEPDLSFLNTLDIDGTLKMAGLLINDITIGEINKHLIIKQGKAQLAPLTAALYEGVLTVNSSVADSNGANNYQVSTQLKDVQLLPLLKDAADVELISGDTNFNFSAKGQGLTTTKIQQGLVAKGDFALRDGELYGVNINQEIRSIKATLKGEAAPTSDSIKKTDFASLTGTFNIDKGLVNNQKLLMTSPVMRLDGAGLVNIIKQTLDYKLGISPLSKTTEETSYADLTGVTIPLIITGSFTDPSFSIDTESVVKQQLQAEVDAQKEKLKAKAEAKLKKQTDKISEKLGTEIDTKGLQDKLKSFF